MALKPKTLVNISYLLIVGTHIYMLFIPLTANQMLPHAISNLIAIYIVFKGGKLL
jgi:nitrate reductase gamma subunit